MLRVEMEDFANARIVKVQGRLSGDNAEYARSLVTQCAGELPLTIDLNEVTFLDAAGEQVLSVLARLGALFIADNVYIRYFCERLHLPLARKLPSNRSPLDPAHSSRPR